MSCGDYIIIGSNELGIPLYSAQMLRDLWRLPYEFEFEYAFPTVAGDLHNYRFSMFASSAHIRTQTRSTHIHMHTHIPIDTHFLF